MNETKTKTIKTNTMKQSTINPLFIVLPILAAIVSAAIYLHSTGLITMSN